MAIPDVLQATVAFLLARPSVSALCGTNVFGYALDDELAPSMPANAVVIHRSGGRPERGYLKYSGTRLDIKCYGATQVDAGAVYYAVKEELKQAIRQKVGNCLISGYEIEGGPMDGTEPEVVWPMVLGVYIAWASEVPVA